MTPARVVVSAKRLRLSPVSHKTQVVDGVKPAGRGEGGVMGYLIIAVVAAVAAVMGLAVLIDLSGRGRE